MQARAATGLQDLVTAGLVTAADVPGLTPVEAAFRIRLSPAMRAATVAAHDPVGRQFVPTRDELTIRPEELADPIGDVRFSPAPGLTHRYPDRVILAATQTCEVYCRFCFRREAVGEEGTLPEEDLVAALGYIAVNPAIREVILTGGDPMTLSPRRLRAIMDRLSAIPHVDVVRLHTRVPVVAPEKVTEKASFIDDLGADSLDTVELVMAFEEEFGVEIPDDAAEKILSVKDAIDFIKANAAA